MDPVIGAMIESRRKSIAKLEVAVGALSQRIAKSTQPTLARVLEQEATVKGQRLERLRGELAALQEEASRQGELLSSPVQGGAPGAAAAAPRPVRK